MKAINIIMSAVQGILVAAYIMFYNVQYYWSLKSTIVSLVHMVIK